MYSFNSKTITYAQLAKVIDHSLLKPENTDQDVIDGCRLAARYHTATVSVKPCHVNLVPGVLANTDIYISTVIGFPHGGQLSTKKLASLPAVRPLQMSGCCARISARMSS